MMEKIRNFFLPRVDPEAQRNADTEIVYNIYRLSIAVLVYELFTLVCFTLSAWPFDRGDWITVGSVLFCMLTCLAGFLGAGRLRKSTWPPHRPVQVLKTSYFLILSLWAVFVSYRHYLRGDQLFTFFTVELLMVCFIPLKPFNSMILMGGVYGALYAVLCRIDGARSVNSLHYLVLVLVSVTAMIVRYHSLIRMSEKTVQLQNSNELLEYTSRHDGLTGLRNRRALDEDVPKVVGTPLTVYMIDVNYFKEVNDTYGHAAGDAVLEETAKRIRRLFEGERCYRYGGDEFLVLDEEVAYEKDIFYLSVPVIPDQKLLLSIGRAQGCPTDYDTLFELIAAADADLYEVKRRTHSPEFGGHDRRRPRV